MSMSREEMKAEALRRLEELVKHQGLNPNVPSYFREDRLYYSYLTAGGYLGSIDTIDYDPRYARIVRNFERIYEGLVYHVIETEPDCLAVLYVSRYPEEWPCEFNGKQGYVMANVYDLANNYDEIGTIQVAGFFGSGALVRIG